MILYERTIVEMQRRAAFLSEEIGSWTGKASSNFNQLGIHKSQFEKLQMMMDTLLERQGQYLKELDPTLSNQEFTKRYIRLNREMAGTHDLWRVFRYIFSQLIQDRLGVLVDAACLVAADCYLSILNRARYLGIIDEEEFREPPLVYMEADLSPATASRGQKVHALGFPVQKYRNLRLPIPIVTLPLDQANSLWLFCSLHHEVGHNLDQDLKLGRELKHEIDQTLEIVGVPQSRREIWRRWSDEILADVFGVLLGGVGFAHSLSSLLMLMAPGAIVLTTEDEHPDPFVRIYLLIELLKQSGIDSMNKAALNLAQEADRLVTPAGFDLFAQDCPLVAQVCWTQRLQALNNSPLSDLVPDLAQNAKLGQDLAKYFRTGIGFDKPVQAVSHRLVPVAAQLRLKELVSPNTEDLDQLQEHSLQYLKSLQRPDFLAAAGSGKFLRKLVDEIDFSLEKEI